MNIGQIPLFLPELLNHLAQNARELVGAGSPALLAVDAREALQGEIHALTFQQGSQGLEVAVAPGNITEIVDLSVNQVEINLTGTNQGRRHGCNVTHPVHGAVAQYLDIFRHF